MIKSDLQSVQLFLENQGMKCAYIPSSEKLPVEQLYISLGLDEKKRDLLLQIKLVEPEISKEQDLLKLPKSKSNLHFMQFFCSLPFQIKKEFSSEVARVILVLNKSFGIPGFEFSEVDGLVYFRSVIPVVNEFDESILIIMIGNIMLNVDVFSSTIEKIGLGQTTIDEIVKSLDQTT